MDARLAPIRSCMMADCLRSTQARMAADVEDEDHDEGHPSEGDTGLEQGCAHAGPASADRAGRVRRPRRRRRSSDRRPRCSGTSCRRRREPCGRARGTSARPASAAGVPPSEVRMWPSRSHAGRAWPIGSTAGRKRCTRPSKLVKVPSRSTHAAAGQHPVGGRARRVGVGPRDRSPSRSGRAPRTRRRPAGPRPAGRDRRSTRQRTRPAACGREHRRRIAAQAEQLGAARVGILVGPQQEVVVAGRARPAARGSATRRIPRCSRSRLSAIRSSLAICGDASTADLARASVERRSASATASSSARRAPSRRSGVSRGGVVVDPARSRSGLRRRSTSVLTSALKRGLSRATRRPSA